MRCTGEMPCPVCGRTKYCCVARDGKGVLCTKVKSDRPCGTGWYHRLAVPIQVDLTHQVSADVTPRDWPALAGECAAAVSPGQRLALADSLDMKAVPQNCLPLIGVLPWAPETVFTFNECNAAGEVIGISTRRLDGAKRMVRGSKRGLTIPVGWDAGSKPVLLVEGATDVLACSLARLACVGRPSNLYGVPSVPTYGRCCSYTTKLLSRHRRIARDRPPSGSSGA